MTATSGPTANGRAAAWSTMATAQTRMELRLLSRRGENLLVTVIIPVGLLLFFGSVAVLPGVGNPPVDFLLPGILALAVISTSMVNLGIATGFERSYGVLKRLGGIAAAQVGPAGGEDRGRCGGGSGPGRAAGGRGRRRVRVEPGAGRRRS